VKRISRPSVRGEAISASFRDPSGFLFRGLDGVLYRQVNAVGAADYEAFIDSGLYQRLVDSRLLVSHEKASLKLGFTKEAHAVIRPEVVPFISYPFEWSFHQLKDAALLTLRIQKIALEYGMSLKDASAYNVQFTNGSPIFIDSLSFEVYNEGSPWQAYRQFCQHFLAPLVLMSYVDPRLSQLLRTELDGIGLELTSKLLPKRAKIKPGIAMHIVMHAKAQKAKQGEHKHSTQKLSKAGMLGILSSLETSIRKMRPLSKETEWANYYNNTNYTAQSADKKAELLVQMLKPLRITTLLDMGGNNGRYSRLLNEHKVHTVCTDIDPLAVDENYLITKKSKNKYMLPLHVDLTNPGGAIGWANEERGTIQDRLQCDMVMALALVHHLAISNNVPFVRFAEYLGRFAKYILVEFVPKEDTQVQKLLSTRKDIFPDYDILSFKDAFANNYTLLSEESIPGTKRTLLLFRKNDGNEN
jgi:ribosomal protein L11 methylase PrmA